VTDQGSQSKTQALIKLDTSTHLTYFKFGRDVQDDFYINLNIKHSKKIQRVTNQGSQSKTEALIKLGTSTHPTYFKFGRDVQDDLYIDLNITYS